MVIPSLIWCPYLFNIWPISFFLYRILMKCLLITYLNLPFPLILNRHIMLQSLFCLILHCFFCQMSKQFILIPMLISGKNRSTRSTDRFLFRSSLLIVTTYSSAPTHSITITAKHTLPTFILTLWFLLTYYMHQMRVGASELCTSKTAAKENSCCPDDTYLSKCWLQQHPLFWQCWTTFMVF